MVDIKKDLDEYLLLQSNQKKNFKLSLPGVPFQKPNVSSWFRRDDVAEPDETWMQKTTKKCCPNLTKFQRIVLFGLCVVMGFVCFSISLMYLPVLLFKARKFAFLFTMGSTFFVLSLFFLWGPLAYIKYMFSKERLGVTLTYGGTLAATLYCALHLQSTPFTVLFAAGQIILLLWMAVSNIPGGTAGLSLFSRLFSRSVTGDNILPI